VAGESGEIGLGADGSIGMLMGVILTVRRRLLVVVVGALLAVETTPRELTMLETDLDLRLLPSAVRSVVTADGNASDGTDNAVSAAAALANLAADSTFES